MYACFLSSIKWAVVIGFELLLCFVLHPLQHPLIVRQAPLKLFLNILTYYLEGLLAYLQVGNKWKLFNIITKLSAKRC